MKFYFLDSGNPGGVESNSISPAHCANSANSETTA